MLPAFLTKRLPQPVHPRALRVRPLRALCRLPSPHRAVSTFALPSALCAPGTLGDFGCYTSAIYEKVEKARGEGRPLPPLLLYSTSPTPLPRPHTPNPWICAGRGWFRHHTCSNLTSTLTLTLTLTLQGPRGPAIDSKVDACSPCAACAALLGVTRARLLSIVVDNGGLPSIVAVTLALAASAAAAASCTIAQHAGGDAA